MKTQPMKTLPTKIPMLNFTATMALKCVITMSFVLLFGSGQQTFGQGFNLEGYLKKKDTNQNGRVEPEELSNNARGILKKMGFDDTKSNSISKIVSRANKEKKAMEEKAKPSNNRTRKTEGFGGERTKSEGVTRFGADAVSAGSTSRGKSQPSFSKSVIERVDSTLKRYDSNKDGSLDRNEMKRARWGSPPPEQNDTNRDGVLSKEELSVRYASREKMFSKTNSSSSVRSTSSKDKGEDDRSKRARDRESFRSSSKSPSTRSSSRSTTRTPSSTKSYTPKSTASSSSSSSDAQAKYERYAASLVDQYDVDKDGKLSADETKKMRRPPAGADANKDGFITKSELVGSLSGTNKSSTSEPAGDAVAVKEKAKSKYSRDRGSSNRSKSRTSTGSRTSSSFDKLDANADKQIQMHEFADKWSDDLVKEFYAKDTNGDGVITLKEWSGK